MKVRHIHTRPALWKGKKDYHAWKKHQRLFRRCAVHAAERMREALRAYMRPIV